MRRLLLVLCLALAPSSAAHAQHGFWRPDDRVLITSFLNARDIATDQRYVFVATTNGLEIYDQTFRRWLPPSTQEDGYPVLERPARIAYDARERGVWLLTEAQTLYSWDTPFQRWQQRFITELPDYVRAGLQHPAGERDAALQIMRNFAGRDAAGRSWRVTGVVPAERSGTFWAASYGGNFSFMDTRSLSSEPYVFGTLSRGTTALIGDPNGYVWFGGDGAGPRNGIARTDGTLQSWRQFEAGIGTAPRGPVHAFSVSPAGLHAAAADGLYAYRDNAWHEVTDTDTRALAYTEEKLWIGGRAGLAWLDAAGAYHRAEFPLQTVYALAARGDTLWIGAETGLYQWRQGNVRQLAAGTQIRDVAITADRLIAITPGGVRMWDGVSLGLPLRTAALERVGQPISVSADAGRVWIGGTAGLAEWNTHADVWRYLTVPADIPEGPVYDAHAIGGHLWLATPAGALRLEWN